MDWKYVYGEAEDKLPSKMLEPKNKEITITSFYDADLSHDHTIGRVVTDIITMLNRTPIDWISKIEMATSGSEMVTTRVMVDQLVKWTYTLRMLGVPLSEN